MPPNSFIIEIIVNNNNSWSNIFDWPYVPRSFPLHDACQLENNWGWNENAYYWLLHKSKYWKVKDRPFAEGSRGWHALICLYAQPLSAKERHVTLPLKMTTFIMQSVAFILCHPSSYNAQFSLSLNDITYLEAIFISFLHRWQLTWRILLNP